MRVTVDHMGISLRRFESVCTHLADMVESGDTYALEAYALRRAGSTPAIGT